MIDRTTKTTGREEDYRDYEERDLDEGWPYADATAGSEVRGGNGSYGQSSENFDETDNPGFQRADDTAIEANGGPDLFGDGTESDVNDDALEESIAMALDDSDADIDISGIEVKARRGNVLLTGAVETQQESRRIEEFAYGHPGVVKVFNRLTARAADGNIPADADE